MRSAFLVAAVLILAPRTSEAAPGVPLPLDGAARKRLDAVALRQPAETIAQERINRVGNVPAWLLGRVELPDSEELTRARAFHDRLRGRETLHTPGILARRTLARLVRSLPPHNRPASFRYTLYLVERDEYVAFSPGGGFVYVSKPLYRALLADPRRAESALAFVLARELGHIGLHHCRRGWQRQVLEEEITKGIASRVQADCWRAALDTGVRGSGSLVHFLYSRDQEYEADLFALQLCSNAGYPGDECLDGLRLLAALRHPGALRRRDYHPEKTTLPATLAYYLSAAADPLLRLRRLLRERAGLVDQGPDRPFGLFLYDRDRGELSRAATGSVKVGQRPIVFVHGMKGGEDSFRDFLQTFGQRRELRNRPLLIFRYPGNGSLAHSGRFLAREMRRVIAAAGATTFICHSAGGLVLRYYAEKLKGEFSHAVLLATPNRGSNLTDLKFLVDLADLAAGARALGPARALAAAIPEGRGQVTFDLHPDSLFLRGLGRNPRLATRYHVFVGEYLTTTQALAGQLLFASSRSWLKNRAVSRLPAGVFKTRATRWLTGLRLPREVIHGDLLVTAASARLPGAGRVTKLPLHHLAMRTDPKVIALVLDCVLGE
jgi:hypothetical protein